jgi:hypothetical protein
MPFGYDTEFMHKTKISVYIYSFSVLGKIQFFHQPHNQPINVPTARTQAFLMDYPQGERAITHQAGPVRIGG